MKEKQKIYDIIRISACFLIVLMHSPTPTDSTNGFFLCSLSFFTAPAIGLFFMVSGALILPVKYTLPSFIKNKLIRIGLPLAAWTILYLLIKIYFSESEISLLHNLFSFPFSNQGPGVFWFLYTIFGLYLLSPILSKWLISASKKEIEFYLILWGISLCYPLIENFISINESNTGILYYFSGYAGYYLLGYYIKNFSAKSLICLSCLFGLTGIVSILLLKFNNIDFNFYRLFWYLSIFIASWSVLYWYIIKIFINLFFKSKNYNYWIIGISNLTFGVYLIHILIMREWLWKSSFITSISNYYLQTILIALLSFFFSLLLSFLISKIPYLKAIIGFKTKHSQTLSS